MASDDLEPPDDLYWSERMHGVPEANVDELSRDFWRGLYVVAEDNFWDEDSKWGSLPHRISGDLQIEWPPPSVRNEYDALPPTAVILNAVEFFGRRLWTKPLDYEGEMQHSGKFRSYQAHVNRLFRLNRHPYCLNDWCRVERTLSPPLVAVLREEMTTGDAEADKLIDHAKAFIWEADIDKQKLALKELWDAFERLKNRAAGGDTKANTDAALAAAVPDSNLRQAVAVEAKAINDFGNAFHIRHTRPEQTLLTRACDVEWAFLRAYALVRLLVKGRPAT